jgi:hypothetical protein
MVASFHAFGDYFNIPAAFMGVIFNRSFSGQFRRLELVHSAPSTVSLIRFRFFTHFRTLLGGGNISKPRDDWLGQ